MLSSRLHTREVERQCAELSLQLDGAERWRDAAYAERDQLVAAISKVWPSHFTKPDASGTAFDSQWPVSVCVHLPSGLVRWHIHPDRVSLFSHLKSVAAVVTNPLQPVDHASSSVIYCPGDASVSDDEKSQRLAALTQQW